MHPRVECKLCGLIVSRKALGRHHRRRHGGTPRPTTVVALAGGSTTETEAPAIAAMLAITEALRPMIAADRRRVLDAVATLYGIEQ